MTDSQKKFVESLRELLEFDALTFQWLMPLDPMLNQSYQRRFRMSSQNVPQYLVFDRTFCNGESWLTPNEFYIRSKIKAKDLTQLGYLGGDIFADAPTGYCEAYEGES